jgi:hypothetical protein
MPGPKKPSSTTHTLGQTHALEVRAVPEKGFFGALFDLTFSSFITTKIIKVLYVLAIIIAGLIALGYVIFAFAADAVLGLVTLVILAPLGFLLYVIYTRVLLELFIAIFRIMETNVELVHLQRGASGGPPPYSPPPYTPPPAPSGPPTEPTTPFQPPPPPPLASS